ncbi:helicase HerA-like domain-containing protein [Rhizobium yanglingense]
MTGATGTGKTVAPAGAGRRFFQGWQSRLFAADIKGDLSGIAAKGEGAKDFLTKRAEQIGFADYEFDQFPVIFWDLFGEKGHRVRTTIAEMGPLLLARLMDASRPDRKRASSISPSRSPTRRACRCSTSRISPRRRTTWARMRASFPASSA